MTIDSWIEDWLQDPLMVIEGVTFSYLPSNASHSAYNSWKRFHFSTRIKLQGADYFLRQLRGATFRPDYLGLQLLAFNFRQWYLDAFFFELLSAYECLVQELNAIYECNVKIYDRRLLSKVLSNLPPDLIAIIKAERQKSWFKRAQWYRNSVSHRARIPTDDMTTGFGDKPWHYSNYQVSMWYFDEDTKELKEEDSGECEKYLEYMLDHIHLVWGKMKEHRFLEPD